MSEHLLKIMLSELATVRVLCKSSTCGAVIEMPLADMPRMLALGECPVCHASFRVPSSSGPDLLAALARSIQAVQAASGRVEIQFVIPQQSP